MTLYQLEKLRALTEQGYKSLGAAENSCGGGTLVEAPDGSKWIVDGAGDLTAAPADAKPVQLGFGVVLTDAPPVACPPLPNLPPLQPKFKPGEGGFLGKVGSWTE